MQLRSRITPRIPRGKRRRYPASAAAARGDWAAMPLCTSADDMRTLAGAIDGHTLSRLLGFGECGALANESAARFQETKRYVGSAAELWCCLCFEARRLRHLQEEELAGIELTRWERLYEALVLALRSDGSVAWLGNGVARWTLNMEQDVWSSIAAERAEYAQHASEHDAVLQSAFRLREGEGGASLEVDTIAWSSPSTAECDWQLVKRWPTTPTAAEVDVAREEALRDARFFEECDVCARRQRVGHMWTRFICQGCASRYFGVLF